MRKIYVVSNDGLDFGDSYARWMEGELVDSIAEADLVVFTGGEDVHPDFYGHPKHPRTFSNRARDRYEMLKFNEARNLGKHIIGICRGSQFLCVANGGSLVQHQDNPYFIHAIQTFDGLNIDITSTHHQAAYPFDLPKDSYRILGWTKGVSEYHEDGNGEELNPEVECEIVYYPVSKCLGIQGHPEMMALNHPTVAYLRDLLDTFLLNNINANLDEEEHTAEEVLAENPDETQLARVVKNPFTTAALSIGDPTW